MSKQSACPECRHILTSGRKCRAIALRGRPFCYQHSRQRSLAADGHYKSVKLPPLEDHASILLSLNQVIRAMTGGRIDHKAAGRCLYAIQLAMQTIRHTEAEPPVEQVTDFLAGRFGDAVAVNDEPRVPEDLYYLLSEYEKSHCSYGDSGWEPTNADYPEPEQSEIVQSKTAGSETSQSETIAIKNTAADGMHADASPAQSAAESSPSPVEPRAADPAGKSATPTVKRDAASPAGKSAPVEQDASALTSKSRPGGTRETSPGRESRVVDSNGEVPEGRPTPRRGLAPEVIMLDE